MRLSLPSQYQRQEKVRDRASGTMENELQDVPTDVLHDANAAPPPNGVIQLLMMTVFALLRAHLFPLIRRRTHQRRTARNGVHHHEDGRRHYTDTEITTRQPLQRHQTARVMSLSDEAKIKTQIGTEAWAVGKVARINPDTNTISLYPCSHAAPKWASVESIPLDYFGARLIPHSARLDDHIQELPLHLTDDSSCIPDYLTRDQILKLKYAFPDAVSVHYFFDRSIYVNYDSELKLKEALGSQRARWFHCSDNIYQLHLTPIVISRPPKPDLKDSTTKTPADISESPISPGDRIYNCRGAYSTVGIFLHHCSVPYQSRLRTRINHFTVSAHSYLYKKNFLLATTALSSLLKFAIIALATLGSRNQSLPLTLHHRLVAALLMVKSQSLLMLRAGNITGLHSLVCSLSVRLMVSGEVTFVSCEITEPCWHPF